jgi:hypothetical protein
VSVVMSVEIEQLMMIVYAIYFFFEDCLRAHDFDQVTSVLI